MFTRTSSGWRAAELMSKRQRRRPQPAATATAVVPLTGETSVLPDLGGQRLRVSQDQPYGGLTAGITLVAPPDSESRWRGSNLDSQTLDRMGPAELIELLADLSPDISRALWDFLRLVNPGWEAQALRPGTEDVDKPAQTALDDFLGVLKGHYGSVDVVLNRLFLSAFLRGGFFAELVLDKTGRMPLDLATPDPRWLHFRRVNDPDRGPIFEPFQWMRGEAVSLAVDTVRYVPVDPLPGSPYGRPLATPALFVTIFALGLLHDLRRVVSQQGYPRIDLEIQLEALTKQMPVALKNEPAQVKKYLEGVVASIREVYRNLQPDDAYVHTDVVKVNRPVGTVDSSSLSAIDGLFKALDRMSIRALKTMPLLFGVNEAASETHANRQWEVHAAGLRTLQHTAEALLEHLFGIALRAQGRQATVRFRFHELRASEEMRDAQTEKVKIENAKAQYDHGWIGQDTAALKGAGVKKADQETPRVTAGTAGTGTEPAPMENPEPGSNRGKRSQRTQTRALVTPKGADEPLPPLPDEVEITAADIQRAQESFDEALPDYAGLLKAEVVGDG